MNILCFLLLTNTLTCSSVDDSSKIYSLNVIKQHYENKEYLKAIKEMDSFAVRYGYFHELDCLLGISYKEVGIDSLSLYWYKRYLTNKDKKLDVDLVWYKDYHTTRTKQRQFYFISQLYLRMDSFYESIKMIDSAIKQNSFILNSHDLKGRMKEFHFVKSLSYEKLGKLDSSLAYCLPYVLDYYFGTSDDIQHQAIDLLIKLNKKDLKKEFVKSVNHLTILSRTDQYGIQCTTAKFSYLGLDVYILGHFGICEVLLNEENIHLLLNNLKKYCLESDFYKQIPN